MVIEISMYHVTAEGNARDWALDNMVVLIENCRLTLDDIVELTEHLAEVFSIDKELQTVLL